MPRNHKITLRKGAAAPSPVDFDVAEPAWDKQAGKLYIKNENGDMVHVGKTAYSFSSTPPVSPDPGHKWTDTDNGITYEYVYDGNGFQWVELGPTPTAYVAGGGTNGPILESQRLITTSYTISSGNNAISIGSVEVADGAEVTVPANCIWMVLG